LNTHHLNTPPGNRRLRTAGGHYFFALHFANASGTSAPLRAAADTLVLETTAMNAE